MADLSLLDTQLPAETTTPDETVALGRQLSPALGAGDVVVLLGELGSGKTHLVMGIAAGLAGDPAAVTSPTFTIAHEYDTAPPVYHLDLYRLSGPEDVRAAGVAEYFEGDGICLVEWPDRAGSLLPADSVVLRLTHAGGDRRRIERVSLTRAEPAPEAAGGSAS